MTAGAVEDDAGEDEDHREDPGQVSEMLLWHESGVVLVSRASEVDGDVAEEGDWHERQTDARKARKARDFDPGRANDLYHQHALVIHRCPSRCQSFANAP
jgi:hypothetical protein